MSSEFSDKEEVNEILLAMREIYYEKKSYSNIAISELAEKSNVPIGKIYTYFTNKDDIAISLIKKAIHDIFVTFDEEVEKASPVSDKIKVFLSLQLEFLGPELKLITELVPHALQPFSGFSSLLIETRKRYLDFLSQLFLSNFNKPTFIFKNISLPIITNSFLLFNLSVFQFWQGDKSEGKQNTLNYIEKGVKNFMVMSTLL